MYHSKILNITASQHTVQVSWYSYLVCAFLYQDCFFTFLFEKFFHLHFQLFTC